MARRDPRSQPATIWRDNPLAARHHKVEVNAFDAKLVTESRSFETAVVDEIANRVGNNLEVGRGLVNGQPTRVRNERRQFYHRIRFFLLVRHEYSLLLREHPIDRMEFKRSGLTTSPGSSPERKSRGPSKFRK